MDGEGYIRLSRGGEVIQHANDGPVAPLMLNRLTGSISSKDHGGWSISRRRLVLKTTSSDNFVNSSDRPKIRQSST